MKKTTKILLCGVGFLLMVIVFFGTVIIWEVATVGVLAPDPEFLEKSIFKSPVTDVDIPDDTMLSTITQYQCQKMTNTFIFDCQMTILYDRKTGVDKIITYQLTIEPNDNFWGERWQVLDIKTIGIVEK